MNSFAALMGSLTGAGISGTVGAGASGTSRDGLFAGLLEANVAANPLDGDVAGAGLKAAFADKDGARAPETIGLATLLQTTTYADGNIIPTDIPVGGAPPIPMVRLVDGEPQPLLPGEPQEAETAENTLPSEGEASPGASPPARTDEAPAAIDGEAQAHSHMTDGSGGDNGARPADTPGQQPAAAASSDTRTQAAARDTTPGQDPAAAGRPAHARPDAAIAPGLTGVAPKAGAAQAATQAAAAPLQSSLGSTQAGDPQEAAKAAHAAANAKAAEETMSASRRPTVIPAQGEAGSRSDLAKPAEIARTIALAPNGQPLLQLIKAGKTDAVPAAGIDQSATAGTHIRSTATPLQPGTQPPQMPLNGIAVHIARQAANGARRFDIRLDPPELGRIEVRLDVSKDGKASTHLVVERSETLDLLQRDARALERALQNAGLDTADGGMKFSLKDQGGDQAHSGARASHGSADSGGGDDAAPSPADIDNATRTGRRYLATGGLDIRI